jgi:hypothetical protein
MFKSIAHSVRHSGFVQKHPILTFLLVVTGLSTVVKVAADVTGKAPTTSQPIKTGGA